MLETDNGIGNIRPLLPMHDNIDICHRPPVPSNPGHLFSPWRNMTNHSQMQWPLHLHTQLSQFQTPLNYQSQCDQTTPSLSTVRKSPGLNISLQSFHCEGVYYVTRQTIWHQGEAVPPDWPWTEFRYMKATFDTNRQLPISPNHFQRENNFKTSAQRTKLGTECSTWLSTRYWNLAGAVIREYI